MTRLKDKFHRAVKNTLFDFNFNLIWENVSFSPLFRSLYSVRKFQILNNIFSDGQNDIMAFSIN